MTAELAECDPRIDEVALRRGAERVLLANWTGRWTVPSRTLYPHQWSWDSAFIALGMRHLSPLRAQQELESLLGAQWSDGRLPHIVFDPAVDPDAYFPGPDFWRSEQVPGAPAARTSGLIQPPVHAIAVWEVFRADPALARRRGFLRRAYPRLVRWHRYLTGRRDLAGSGLAAIVHPWESGMDNSPAWDRPLSRIEPVEAGLIRRRDLRHAAAEDRPTTVDYGRYVRLAGDYRDRGYRDDPGRDAFAVEDPMVNGLLAAAEQALAAIARELGLQPGIHLTARDEIVAAMDRRLFSPRLGLYVPRDLVDDRQIPECTVAGLIPMSLSRRDLAAVATGPRFRAGRVAMVPSYDLTSPGFDAGRYWRGPSWFNTAWLVHRGLVATDAHDAAAQLRHSILAAATTAGFREYIDPYTLAGHGSGDFSWTAAVVLDLLRT